MEISIISNWNKYLNFFNDTQKDIYYTEEYVKLYEKSREKAECFVCRDNNNVLLFPYLSRTFVFNGKEYKDFETAYGYGGPISNSKDASFNHRAEVAFIEYSKSQRYVAGFVCFHPLLCNVEYSGDWFRIIKERNTIAIDLTGGEECVWMNEIHTKNRNIIRKGIKNGLSFVADYEYKYLNVFIELYNQTMEKLNANKFYYFNDGYYSHLKESLPNSFLGLTMLNDKVLSAAIFFFTRQYGHYHLSGSDNNALKLSANNFMLWEAAKEMLKHGVKYFHLGGGINSDEQNSLFIFKKKFSKSECQFYIGKIIFNQSVYNALCEEWTSRNQEKEEIYKYHLLKYKY